MRLLTYNIRRGGRGRIPQLGAVIRAAAPDVVVLQEATEPAIVEVLAEDAGLEAWVSAPGESVGMASRLEIAEHRWHRPRGVRHGVLEIRLAASAVRIFGVHLSAVHANVTEGRRLREIQALLAVVDAGGSGPHVLAGDFNTLAPGASLDLARLPPRLRLVAWAGGRRIRWRTIAHLVQSGYVDAYRHLNPAADGFTFPTWDPHVRLDYVFVPAADADRLGGCNVLDGVDGAAMASDHFPLLAEIAM
ncbi:MAG: endonuclease/exonuclease/phosphatase family protein [Vicinamibacteraceae bacterium]|nr:endonuclease/exonuclease/phosphatase family protein [Vicinamibacteraceae bacterium]